jgi:hypothetical protein
VCRSCYRRSSVFPRPSLFCRHCRRFSSLWEAGAFVSTETEVLPLLYFNLLTANHFEHAEKETTAAGRAQTDKQLKSIKT